MSEKSQALRLITDLLADFNDPSFVWQGVALVACLGLSFLIARWWRGRHLEGAGRLSDASSRLVFPLTGMVLTGITVATLGSLIHVNLLKLAMPLLGSMALVRSVIFVLRQAFPRATWLTAWERIIAATVWGWLALYITDLAPHVIDTLEGVVFPLGAQRLNLWMILQGIVTVFLTVVVALWVAGVIEARLMRMEGVDSSLRIVGVRVAKALLTVAALVTGTPAGPDLDATVSVAGLQDAGKQPLDVSVKVKGGREDVQHRAVFAERVLVGECRDAAVVAHSSDASQCAVNGPGNNTRPRRTSAALPWNSKPASSASHAS